MEKMTDCKYPCEGLRKLVDVGWEVDIHVGSEGAVRNVVILEVLDREKEKYRVKLHWDQEYFESQSESSGEEYKKAFEGAVEELRENADEISELTDDGTFVSDLGIYRVFNVEKWVKGCSYCSGEDYSEGFNRETDCHPVLIQK
jgi:hypothetical protein